MPHQGRVVRPSRPPEDADGQPPRVELTPVDQHNWRACADLRVDRAQRAFVGPVTRYLALCAYDQGPWRPAALTADDRTVGFVMRAVDPADDSFWVGGLVIDRRRQRRGYGRAAMEALIRYARTGGHAEIALSYSLDNTAARALYRSLGFVETGETEGAEVVARLALDQARDVPCTERSR